MQPQKNQTIRHDPDAEEALYSLPDTVSEYHLVWLTVLRDTVADYRQGKARKRKHTPSVMAPLPPPGIVRRDGTRYVMGSSYNFNMACEWLFSDTLRERGFRWVCSHVGLDPDVVRHSLIERYGAP